MMGKDTEVLSREETFVLHCLRTGTDAWNQQYVQRLLTGGLDWALVGAIARKWGVAPLFYYSLRKQDLDAAVLAPLEDDLRFTYLRASAQNSLMFSELKRILAALRGAGVQVIVLKGAALAETVYPNRSVRPMGDIDLMVHRENLSRAVFAVCGIGYSSSTRLSLDAQAGISHHVRPLVNSKRAILEIHWTLVRPDRPFKPDVDRLWERAQPAGIADVPVAVLAPEDLLLHLSFQASEDRFVRMLRYLCDIDHVVRHYAESLDWQAIVDRSSQWGGRNSAYLVLYLAKALLGVAVPEQILRDLRAGNIDERIPGWAASRILGRDDESRSLGPRFMRLWNTGSYRQRMRLLLTMLFPSPEVVADLYGVRADSRRLYYFYVLRLKDEILRTYQVVMRLLSRDPVTRRVAEQDKILSDWLESA